MKWNKPIKPINESKIPNHDWIERDFVTTNPIVVDIFKKLLNISDHILFNAKSRRGGYGSSLNNENYNLIGIDKDGIDGNIFKYTQEDYDSITSLTKVFFAKLIKEDTLRIIDLKQNVARFIQWVFKKASYHSQDFNNYLNRFDENGFYNINQDEFESTIVFIIQTYLVDYFKDYFISDIYDDANKITLELMDYNISYKEYLNTFKRAAITRSIDSTLSFPYTLVLTLNESFWTII